MTVQPESNLSIRLSVRIYSLLLKAYPAGYRREYGPLMLQLFRDCSRDARDRAGLAGLFSFWTRILFDWLKSVIEERTAQETEMTRPKLIRLSGWAMVVGAAAMMLAMTMDGATIRAGLYQIAGFPETSERYDQYLTFSETFGLLIGGVGIILIQLGLRGLKWRYGNRMGRPGKDSLAISSISGWVALLGVSGLIFNHETWTVLMFGLAMQFSALAVFGVFAMRTNLMPRGNFLPVAAGAYIPLFVIASLVVELLTGGGWLELPRWLEAPLITTTFLSLAMLGYLLQLDAAQTRR